jgi:hypothetical protein
MMKHRIFAMAALALLLACAARATASIVYSNGPINGNYGYIDISNPNVVTDSFTVAGPTSLTGAQNVGIWVLSGDTPKTLNWSIGTTPFGSQISSGIATPSNTQLTPSSKYGLNGSYSVFSSAFPLNGTVTSGTTYWLTLSNGTSVSGDLLLWDVNQGPSSAESAYGGGSPHGDPSESFQLSGLASVPEPSSLFLCGLFASGVIGGYLRRRLKTRHPAQP